MHFPGAAQTGFAHSTALHTGDATGDADHQAGGHHAATFIPLLDEVLDHLLSGVEVSNDAIAQGTHRTDVSRRAPEHQLGFFANRQGNAFVKVDGNHRRFTQHDPLACGVDQGVGGAQILSLIHI